MHWSKVNTFLPVSLYVVLKLMLIDQKPIIKHKYDFGHVLITMATQD